MDDSNSALKTWVDSLQLNWGTTLFLDAPRGLQLGVDLMMWATGEKFKGVNFIPCGVHYVYWQIGESEFAPSRSGRFVNINPQQTLCFRWNAGEETFETLVDVECGRYASGVDRGDFMGSLGPYDFKSAEEWIRLSSFLCPGLVDKLQPMEATIPSTQQPGAEDELEGGTAEIYFTDIPTHDTNLGQDSPEAVTKRFMDKSGLLGKVLDSCGGVPQLLGELQTAFIVFLLGQNYDGFHQWKSLVLLLCRSGDSIVGQEKYFSMFIECLKVEIPWFPMDFFDDAANNFFVGAVGELLESCEGTALKADVLDMCSILEDKHGISVDNILNRTDGPVVVDETEQYIF